ncbi:MAG: hypothetical protein EZS28_046997, partial [Streblomastix strix]
PKDYLNENRRCESTDPTEIQRFNQRTAEMQVEAKGCTKWVIISWFVLISGVIFGLSSLAMAIIFDTNIGKSLDW